MDNGVCVRAACCVLRAAAVKARTRAEADDGAACSATKVACGGECWSVFGGSSAMPLCLWGPSARRVVPQNHSNDFFLFFSFLTA